MQIDATGYAALTLSLSDKTRKIVKKNICAKYAPKLSDAKY